VGISAVVPLWAVEGGRISILGENLLANGAPPAVRIGPADARVVRASNFQIDVLVPPGVEGRVPVRVEALLGSTVFIDVGAEIASGLHLVDNPAFDRRGTLYATFSGTRSQQSAVSIYRIQANRAREPFVSAIAHPTGLACGSDDALYVTDRFEGALYRVNMEGEVAALATGLGSPCGLAFGSDSAIYVGDRAGSIFRVDRSGTHETVASLPPSIAAYHLAWGPDDRLYVSVPTLASHDSLYTVDRSGAVEALPLTFGRPQGLTFDGHGRLYVVEALAGSCGVYRIAIDRPDRAERVLAASAAVGLAFDPAGGLVLASGPSLYSLAIPEAGASFGVAGAATRSLVKPAKS
jgi:sugar lactone lactonase YvrE